MIIAAVETWRHAAWQPHQGVPAHRGGDAVVLLGLATGRDLGHVAFPPSATPFIPLTADPYTPLAVTGSSMIFLGEDGQGRHRVVAFNVSTRAFTELDLAGSARCAYWAKSVPGLEDVFLVRSECGPTKVTHWEYGRRVAELEIPDAPGRSCALGCWVTNIVPHFGIGAMIVLDQTDSSRTSELVAVTVRGTMDDVLWRRALASSWNSVADLGKGCGHEARCLLINGELIGDRDGRPVATAAPMPPSATRPPRSVSWGNTLLLAGDNNRVLRYDRQEGPALDSIDPGCAVRSMSVTASGNADVRVLVVCGQKLVGLALY